MQMILAKDNGYFRCIFVSDILETKEYLFLTAKARCIFLSASG